MTIITVFNDTGEVLVTHNEDVDFEFFCNGYEALAVANPKITEGSTILRTAKSMMVKVPDSQMARPKTILYMAETIPLVNP
jgi:hypothetical protein